MIASQTQRLNQVYQAVEIEALAAIHALEFAAEIGIDRIVVKGDSKIIAEALETKNLGLVVYGLFVADASVF